MIRVTSKGFKTFKITKIPNSLQELTSIVANFYGIKETDFFLTYEEGEEEETLISTNIDYLDLLKLENEILNLGAHFKEKSKVYKYKLLILVSISAFIALVVLLSNYIPLTEQISLVLSGVLWVLGNVVDLVALLVLNLKSISYWVPVGVPLVYIPFSCVIFRFLEKQSFTKQKLAFLGVFMLSYIKNIVGFLASMVLVVILSFALIIMFRENKKKGLNKEDKLFIKVSAALGAFTILKLFYYFEIK